MMDEVRAIVLDLPLSMEGSRSELRLLMPFQAAHARAEVDKSLPN